MKAKFLQLKMEYLSNIWVHLFCYKILNTYYHISISCFLGDIDLILPNVHVIIDPILQHFCFFDRYWTPFKIFKICHCMFVGSYWSHITEFTFNVFDSCAHIQDVQEFPFQISGNYRFHIPDSQKQIFRTCRARLFQHVQSSGAQRLSFLEMIFPKVVVVFSLMFVKVSWCLQSLT